MATRVESAARTRRALLDAASELLDAGGPDAVTLREVGNRAGVSRTAPYRHFADKEALLMALAAQAWTVVADSLAAIAGADVEPRAALRSALEALSDLGRTRPHLYRLMFAQPAADAIPAPVDEAAGRAQNVFLELVAAGTDVDDPRPYAGILTAAAHGLTDLDLSGHLPVEKWHADRHRLIELLIELLPSGRA
ncbi:TetR/AcrR family transcriptional regulator [Gordonia soli]|uniref:Putative TetR family transcriptional regulator n=1 Tax=Gordonia soli NBRC 108243 TaxID=1223545 RepID=M0QNF0_9ACTN|nr:TetR/AcrR family transcriptional regulator [Gordonia soli]GAC70098.1 putative TetR family transcriptional regulator [Gordonia soli NBRC 108243]